MQFSKPDLMGEAAGGSTDRPTSRMGQNNQKQVGVLYGHNGGGKVYNYLAGQYVRAGDTVTPEVTHPKSGKTYKTLGRVVSTRNASGSAAEATSTHLSSQGIMMKTIGSTDQRSLPGYHKGWEQEAQAKYDQQIMRRLNPMGEVTK
jgi:hypothetical protein